MTDTEGIVETAAVRLRRDEGRLDGWRAFLTAHARVTRRLDEELRTEHDISLAEYDALLQLADAPDRRLRMSRLADLVLLSRSGVTRLIDRLEADGSVERTQCAHDARGAEAVLTDAGLARLRTASHTHLAGVERYFLAHLDLGELDALQRVLDRVSRAAGPGPGADVPGEPRPGGRLGGSAAPGAGPRPDRSVAGSF